MIWHNIDPSLMAALLVTAAEERRKPMCGSVCPGPSGGEGRPLCPKRHPVRLHPDRTMVDVRSAR